MMERFLAAVPRESRRHAGAGPLLLLARRSTSARARTTNASVAANPESVEAWRGLGLAHLRSGDAARALECLDRALKLRPEHADAVISRAQALLELERATRMRRGQARADLAPHEPKAWFVLAQASSERARGGSRRARASASPRPAASSRRSVRSKALLPRSARDALFDASHRVAAGGQERPRGTRSASARA
jgi:predicted Zn-dependent protease